MPKTSFLTALFLFLFFVWGINTGAQAAADKTPSVPAPIAELQKSGAQLKYLGRDLGFDGWIAIQNGQEQYFYVTPDGSAFFLGVLFNKNGRAVTFDQMKRIQGQANAIPDDLANAPSQRVEAPTENSVSTATQAAQTPVSPPAGTSKSEQLFTDIVAGHSFAMGKNPSAPTIYMFADPLCPHCKDMIRLITPALEKGTIQAKILLVGALTPDSAPLASGILSQNNPGSALRDFMDGRKMPEKGNANDPRIVGNLNIMAKWRFGGTPVTVYRAKDGKIKILQGPPKSLDILLQDLR